MLEFSQRELQQTQPDPIKCWGEGKGEDKKHRASQIRLTSNP